MEVPYWASPLQCEVQYVAPLSYGMGQPETRKATAGQNGHFHHSTSLYDRHSLNWESRTHFMSDMAAQSFLDRSGSKDVLRNILPLLDVPEMIALSQVSST